MDIFQEASRIILVMERVPGSDIYGYIMERGALSEEMAKTLAVQLFSTLKYMHSIKIVHRDINPGNLMIHKTDFGESRLKIIDFNTANSLYDKKTN
jgi:serine/threonine protein kinase